jgi:hypothetical protein
MAARRRRPGGIARLFSERERRILGYLQARRQRDRRALCHLYEIAKAIRMSEPTVFRGLLELLGAGLVQKHPPRASSSAPGTFVRPYALTQNGRRICAMLEEEGAFE